MQNVLWQDRRFIINYSNRRCAPCQISIHFREFRAFSAAIYDKSFVDAIPLPPILLKRLTLCDADSKHPSGNASPEHLQASATHTGHSHPGTFSVSCDKRLSHRLCSEIYLGIHAKHHISWVWLVRIGVVDSRFVFGWHDVVDTILFLSDIAYRGLCPGWMYQCTRGFLQLTHRAAPGQFRSVMTHVL